MPLNSRELWIGRLLAAVSISAIVFAGYADGEVFGTGTPEPDSSATQLSGDWDRYAIKGEEFSVLLPTAPAMTTYELRPDSLSRNRIRHIIGTYSQGVVYAIYVIERKQSLEEYIGQSRYSSPSDSKRDVKVGEWSGKEYAFQDQNTRRVTQYFSTKRYIYSFIAQGSFLGNADVGIPRFFESIKFEPIATGTPIVDGPGDQSTSDAAAGRIVSGKETTTRAVVVTKPEPTYTEDARKNQITGTVVLRCVFTSSGSVANLRVVSDLPHGLSDQAIAAARQIKFIPAIKDGQFVSMYIQLEYNFNLY